MKRLLYIFAVVSLLCGCVIDESGERDAGSDEGSVVRVGDKLPRFSVEVTDGLLRWQFSSVSLGGPTVIVFFNTGCTDCQRELPELNDYYLRHRSAPGFSMIAIAREESEESIASYWQQQNLSIPYSPQEDRKVYSLFATQYIPRVYFCSGQGVVLWMGVENFDLPH
jgi:peroxiredoxin